MIKLALAVVAVGFAPSIASAAVITLSLDFGSSTSPVVIGHTAVTGNFLANTESASVTDINGLGYGFSIQNVGVFSNDNTSAPLTTDGFYTFSNDSLPHDFTISGLSAGDTVSLYAVAGWDGNTRGAQVVFGGSTVQAQTIGTPGTTPTIANYTLIGTDTATATGTLTGSINGAGFPGTPDSEGQVGGFLIQITTVPEPSSLMLGMIGVSAVCAIRRRK